VRQKILPFQNLVLFWILYFSKFGAKTSSILSSLLGEGPLGVLTQKIFVKKSFEQNIILKGRFFYPHPLYAIFHNFTNFLIRELST